MVTKAEVGFPKSADEVIENYVKSMRNVLVASIAFTTEKCEADDPEFVKKLGDRVSKAIADALIEATGMVAGSDKNDSGRSIVRMAWLSVLQKSIDIASGKDEHERKAGGVRTMAFELLSQAHAALRAAKGLGFPTHVDEVSEVAKKIDDYLDLIPVDSGNAVLDNVVYFEQSLWEALRIVSEAKKEASK